MNLQERVKNKIFKCNLNCTVEYHAGGFFIRKQVAYLIFTETLCYFFEREEGLHPSDNNYQLLINELQNKKGLIEYEITGSGDNILILSNSNLDIKVMPSIFIENVELKNLTELLLDKQNGGTQIFNHVYSILSHNIY